MKTLRTLLRTSEEAGMVAMLKTLEAEGLITIRRPGAAELVGEGMDSQHTTAIYAKAKAYLEARR